MTDFGVTSLGFVRKSYVDILDNLKGKARELFGNDIDLSNTSPLLKILQNVAYELHLRWDAMEGVYYSAYIETAIGSSLDQIASIFSLSRKPATKSVGIVTFSGSDPMSNDVIIPAETSISSGPSWNPYVIFKTVEEITMLKGQQLADVSVASVGYGVDQNVVANTITEFTESKPSTKLTVSNSSPTVSGSDKETDAHFRIRSMGYIFTLGKGTLLALKNAVLALEGVVNVLAVEDLSEHSVSLVVRGGDVADIDETIWDIKPAGIFVAWERPTPVSFDVECNIIRLPTYKDEEVETNAEEAIVDWFESRPIGEDLDFSKILREVVNAEGVDEVDLLVLTGPSETIDKLGDEATILVNEMAVVGDVTIVIG